MTVAEMIALYNEYERKRARFPGMRRETGPGYVRLVDTDAEGRGVLVYSELDEATADEAIAAQIAYFKALGQPFEWKAYSFDRPADLTARLERQGFEVGEEEALVMMDLARAPAVLRQPVTHDVRRILETEGLDDVMAVEEAVWEEEMPGLRSMLEAGLREESDNLSIYVAYVAGVAASSAWVYFQPGSPIASLWGGSTLAAYRKQGLYTALLAARAQEALQRGARYLTTDASPDSRPILEKLGFVLLGFTWECNWGVETGD